MGIKINLILLGISILFTLSPILIAVLGLGLAQLLGCESQGPEIVCQGKPFLSQLLSAMTIGHWLALITLPFGGVVSAILLVILAFQLILKQI